MPQGGGTAPPPLPPAAFPAPPVVTRGQKQAAPETYNRRLAGITPLKKPSAIISHQQHWSRQISQQPTLL